jgi:large subunit ribosomal protein L16
MINPSPRYFRKWNRKVLRNTYENKSNRIRFGVYGLQALTKGFLTARQIETVRRTITSRLKRRGKVWIRSYPDYPRTAKPKEVRMGRGKGAVDHWSSVIKPGRILFEVKSRESLLVYDTLKFVQRKIPFETQVVGQFLKF